MSADPSPSAPSKNTARLFVDVAIPLPVRQTFTYRVPTRFEKAAKSGARVLVPFGRGERIGWIDRIHDKEPENSTREIAAVLDDTPSVPADLLRLCRWTADYYVASLGQVLRTALPAGMSDTSTDFVELVDGVTPRADASAAESQLVDWLRDADGRRSVSRLRSELGIGAWWPVIRRLEEVGALRVTAEPPQTEPAVKIRRMIRLTKRLPSLSERDAIFGRAHRQRQCWEMIESMEGTAEVAHLVGHLGFTYAVVNGLADRGVAEIVEEEVLRDPYLREPIDPAPIHEPTADQHLAISALTQAARTSDPGTFLLRGVTGSGKTLVYIELLREVVDVQGRSAIVLVPEIALTPQTVGRFRSAFGDRVAVLHSALSNGERYDEWRSLRSGEKRIAVGARSAVFAPLPDLGAIVVDEEHEGSYKQGEAPRYHAREVAVVRASMAGAICVLGSATPSLETWANATEGKYSLLELPVRVSGQALPKTRVVDLKAERRRLRDAGETVKTVVLSEDLQQAVRDRLNRAEQTILLLNRRGYANFVQCPECGHVWVCPSCAVSLTYHRRRDRLTCHYCLHQEEAPSRCERCQSPELNFRGLGTEQVERTLEDAFPSARIARMDVDTTSAKWSHHRILKRFGKAEIDILMGTQMIAKGLDFPGVTLVGVINADVGINLPDFRATERTFQLLTQVAGRAGRGPKGGEVVIQTSLPNHYGVTCSLEHDFHGFAEKEMVARRSPRYPPFCRLTNIVVSGRDEIATQEAAERASVWLHGLATERALGALEIVGPAPCPIERIRDRWRWHILLKSSDSAMLGRVSRYFYERFRVSGGKDELRVAVDRDPVALL